MKGYDVDLAAYLGLNELSKVEADPKILEDITSKMRVHSKKIEIENPNVNFKW